MEIDLGVVPYKMDKLNIGGEMTASMVPSIFNYSENIDITFKGSPLRRELWDKFERGFQKVLINALKVPIVIVDCTRTFKNNIITVGIYRRYGENMSKQAIGAIADKEDSEERKIADIVIKCLVDYLKTVEDFQ